MPSSLIPLQSPAALDGTGRQTAPMREPHFGTAELWSPAPRAVPVAEAEPGPDGHSGMVVAALRERGVLRWEYAGTTSCGHLAEAASSGDRVAS